MNARQHVPAAQGSAVAATDPARPSRTARRAHSRFHHCT